jgi:formylglycine-generating enzyme required for sulfatase activity
VGDLVDRLSGCDDDGSRRRRWVAPARITVETTPPGATVTVERHEARGAKIVAVPQPSLASPAEATLAPGSYVLAFSSPGRAPARLPILLRRDERRAIRVELLAAIPDGFLHVPAGRFLYGSADIEDIRGGFFNAAPLHERDGGAYLIARHEVTFADWIEFLSALPPAERARRRPRGFFFASASDVELRDLGDAWELRMRQVGHTYAARAGEPLRYRDRDRRTTQDWRIFPVSGVSHEDAVAYAAWLDRTGRVPGARVCSDREWERAARGADARHYPGGDRLSPDDANFDLTYGRAPLAYGPDEVGSHPEGRSPFGLDDMAGNVWEWTTRVGSGAPAFRGGGFYGGAINCPIVNSEAGEATQRDPHVGLRLCASVR